MHEPSHGFVPPLHVSTPSVPPLPLEPISPVPPAPELAPPEAPPLPASATAIPPVPPVSSWPVPPKPALPEAPPLWELPPFPPAGRAGTAGEGSLPVSDGPGPLLLLPPFPGSVGPVSAPPEESRPVPPVPEGVSPGETDRGGGVVKEGAAAESVPVPDAVATELSLSANSREGASQPSNAITAYGHSKLPSALFRALPRLRNCRLPRSRGASLRAPPDSCCFIGWQ
jgi:hypothetical protein